MLKPAPAAFFRAGRGALTLFGREALRIVLPSWCVACGEELPWRDRKASCCARCWSSLPRIETPRCRSCALPAPLQTADPYLCFGCTAEPLPVEWCEAWGEYRGALAKVLQALKFRRHDFLDAALAALLEERLRERNDLAFDAIVAVPMPRRRERRRGYNQAELLGRALSARVAIPFDGRLLIRRQEGETQSTLPRAARAANVRRAFVAAPGAASQSILLVDDICTTAETLRACSTALRKAGAARVCALTVAKAT